MPRNKLEEIINDFKIEDFAHFFRLKAQAQGNFRLSDEKLSQYNDSDFSKFVKLGQIEFSATEKLIVIGAEVKNNLSDRSGKRKQYEKAKKILKELSIYSAGIFIFYDRNGNFRFSFVYPESIGVRRQWNNFRRFTYFVSVDPQITNKTFLKQIGDGDWSTLEQVKNAFSVTAVTDLFYKEFFEIFNKLTQATGRINKIESEDKIRDFVLLLVIRIIFLGFIQKKKWLGDNEKFIQNFFKEYKNKFFGKNKFYSRWLTPLFFEALNSPQGRKVSYSDNDFSKDTEGKLQMAPFLNGGLFKEKIGYDTNGWVIPDKEIGDFFEFLFAHSFTIEENSLEDEDLQLNPEFLGIIFERLVNGADGSIYTPRTEVDLMCRLSLLEWLQKNLTNVVKVDNLYELFFKESELEEDQKEGSFSLKEAKEILDKLQELTICDPAVGSGAFLVGMMQVLDDIEQSLKKRHALNGKNLFERKREIIKNSLYGVEVKEWAVWICQLRLWLSLFVDAPNDLRNSMDPILPSLDFKVRQGDSLVQRVGSKAFPIYGHNIALNKSIKDKITKLKNLKLQYFDNQSELKEWELRQRELAIYEEILNVEIREKENELREEKNIKPVKVLSLFGDDKDIEQEQLEFNKEEAKALENEIAELKEQKQVLHKDKPLVWGIEFADVFGEKGGFDIIIGNPPYVRQEDIADPMGKIKDKKVYKGYLQDMVKMDFPDYFGPKTKINAQSDLYAYFYIRALRLLNPQGVHTFICSNSWLDVGYGVWLQDFLLNNCPVEFIIDNHAKRSFEAADVNTIISIIHAPIKKIDSNHLVKFVAFKKPFEESIFTENLLAIESADKVESNDIFRVYPISIKDLKESGTEYEDDELKLNSDKYVGEKWGGKFLRAPDIFFTILEKGKERLDKFKKYLDGERYLNTGGADGFFIITEAKKLNNNNYFINNSNTDGDSPGNMFSGELNEKYLRNLIKDLTKKKKNIEIDQTDAKCLVVESPEIDHGLRNYIEWGERQGYDQRSVTKTQKPWYKPTRQMISGAEILLPRSFNDIFVVYYNPNKFLSLRFYRLHSRSSNSKNIVAYLNSTLFWLIFETLGNKSQGQGVLDFYMEDFLKVKIPIILSENILGPFEIIKHRDIKSIFEECGIDPKLKTSIEEQEPNPLSDRAELDKIIFDALELSEKERKDVYRAVCRLVWNRISKANSL